MWESLKDIIIRVVESPLLYVGTMGVLFVLLKNGLISIDTGSVRIGKTRENERRIISSQIAWATLHFDAIATKMCIEKNNINAYHIKYTVGRLQDEIVRRIATNHLSTDQVYMNEVYLSLLDITRKRAGDPWFWSAEFEEFVMKETNEILTTLIMIRNRISKG